MRGKGENYEKLEKLGIGVKVISREKYLSFEII